MKTIVIFIRTLTLTCLFLGSLLAVQPALADEGNISPTDKHAWSEGTGWISFRPTHGGVTVHVSYLSGYAWSGNVGWIRLGNGSTPYLNTDADNWGVSTDSEGNLSGYAWSEAAGWISFSTPPYSQMTMDPEGRFDGYAWSQNLGWILFRNDDPAYNVRKINIAPVLASSDPELTDLTDDHTDNDGVLISDIVADTITDVGDGAPEGVAIYSADPGNGEWQSSIDGGITWTPAENLSETAALLLGSEDRIRFVPDGIGSDNASFSFHAWDQTSGTSGENADISVRGGTTAFSTENDTASVTIHLILDISGTVVYVSDEAPVSGILLTLENADDVYETAETDENGWYVFSDVLPGDYTLTPSRDDASDPVCISSSDASDIARFVVGLYEFGDDQMAAADVTGNGTVTGTDAGMVSLYSAGLRTSMNEEGANWKFGPASLSLSANDSDVENQNFSATRLGDVSGNCSPGHERRTTVRTFQSSDPGLSQTLKVFAEPGSVLSVPIVLNHGTGIRGIDIVAEFDEDVLGVAGVTLARGIL